MLASVLDRLDVTIGKNLVAPKRTATRLKKKKKVKAAGQLSRPFQAQKVDVLKVSGLECI